jgi:hypothetical protein
VEQAAGRGGGRRDYWEYGAVKIGKKGKEKEVEQETLRIEH